MSLAYITVDPGAHYHNRASGIVHKNVLPNPIILEARHYACCADPLMPSFELRVDNICRTSFSDLARKLARKDFVEPRFSYLDPFSRSPSPKAKKPDVIPPFVAPEPPADPVEPTPAPDSAEVAVLRSLLGDRQHVRHTYDSDLASEQEAIEDLERELIEAKARAAHLEHCIIVVDLEIASTTAAIRKLGGTVAEDVG